MLFKLRNIGPVEFADIEVKGLTIITGLNDTGKSFISKSIYSTVKAIKEADEQDLYSKIDAIDPLIRQLMVRVNVVPSSGKIINHLRSRLYDGIIARLSLSGLINTLNEIEKSLLSEIEEQYSLSRFNSETKANVIAFVSHVFFQIQSALKEEERDDQEKLFDYFDKVAIQQLFRGQLNSLNQKLEGIISCYEGGEEIVNLRIKDNATIAFDKGDNFYFQDATIVDSPIILQLSYFIRQQRVAFNYLRRKESRNLGLPHYYLDLLAKLPSIDSTVESFKEIFSQIEKVISGQLVFEENSNDFVFKRKLSDSNGNEPIESFNIATGIKSFGIIQLLLNSGAINPTSILIIDEPEVHLHPKWEIEYAKILVALSKVGIPIVISTHSPYLLKALKKYVHEYEVAETTKFYFGQKQAEGMSHFDDVTEDLSPIFEALAKPMADLI